MFTIFLLNNWLEIIDESWYRDILVLGFFFKIFGWDDNQPYDNMNIIQTNGKGECCND